MRQIKQGKLNDCNKKAINYFRASIEIARTRGQQENCSPISFPGTVNLVPTLAPCDLQTKQPEVGPKFGRKNRSDNESQAQGTFQNLQLRSIS